MSERRSRNAKNINYDERSFIQLWYALPEAGQMMLDSELRKKQIDRMTRTKWVNGSVPREQNIKYLQKTIIKCFGIYTKPYTLFPLKEVREYQARKYKEERERNEWDGVPKWPSLNQEDDENTQ